MTVPNRSPNVDEEKSEGCSKIIVIISIVFLFVTVCLFCGVSTGDAITIRTIDDKPQIAPEAQIRLADAEVVRAQNETIAVKAWAFVYKTQSWLMRLMGVVIAIVILMLFGVFTVRVYQGGK